MNSISLTGTEKGKNPEMNSISLIWGESGEPRIEIHIPYQNCEKSRIAFDIPYLAQKAPMGNTEFHTPYLGRVLHRTGTRFDIAY